MSTSRAAPGHYLIASDFDQTLSFNDSGLVLSELIGVPNFREKVAGLSNIHLVQQGAELTYLLRHDPEFRCVRREHLIATGKQVRLKKDIKRIARRTVISDNALSVLVPILEDVVGWDAVRIRQLFASKGLALQQWDKARTDWVTLRQYSDVGTR